MCSDCHEIHPRRRAEMLAGGGERLTGSHGRLRPAREMCVACHAETAGPFVFEHDPVAGLTGEGCVECHRPHGSINRQFLVERDNNLCLKCHLQIQGPDVLPGDFMIGKVSHANFIKRGSCWSAGCHEAVHGSNVNPHLLY